MQEQFDDLKLRVTFQHPLGQIPSFDLWKTVRYCEEAINQSEYYDVLAVSRALELPVHVYQALLWQLDRKKGETIQIEFAGKGSILLGALIAATAYWILNNTLGEAFKEAWKETGMRKKVKEVLLHRLDKKPEIIAEDIKKKVESDDELSLRVEYEFKSDKGSPTVISIYVYPEVEREPAPTRRGFAFN